MDSTGLSNTGNSLERTTESKIGPRDREWYRWKTDREEEEEEEEGRTGG